MEPLHDHALAWLEAGEDLDLSVRPQASADSYEAEALSPGLYHHAGTTARILPQRQIRHHETINPHDPAQFEAAGRPERSRWSGPTKRYQRVPGQRVQRRRNAHEAHRNGGFGRDIETHGCLGTCREVRQHGLGDLRLEPESPGVDALEQGLALGHGLPGTRKNPGDDETGLGHDGHRSGTGRTGADDGPQGREASASGGQIGLGLGKVPLGSVPRRTQHDAVCSRETGKDPFGQCSSGLGAQLGRLGIRHVPRHGIGLHLNLDALADTSPLANETYGSRSDEDSPG